MRMDCGYMHHENGTNLFEGLVVSGPLRRRTARDQVSFPPVSACRASRMVIIRVMGSTGDG